jgi:hypothetical protein
VQECGLTTQFFQNCRSPSKLGMVEGMIKKLVFYFLFFTPYSFAQPNISIQFDQTDKTGLTCIIFYNGCKHIQRVFGIEKAKVLLQYRKKGEKGKTFLSVLGKNTDGGLSFLNLKINREDPVEPVLLEFREDRKVLRMTTIQYEEFEKKQPQLTSAQWSNGVKFPPNRNSSFVKVITSTTSGLREGKRTSHQEYHQILDSWEMQTN